MIALIGLLGRPISVTPIKSERNCPPNARTMARINPGAMAIRGEAFCCVTK
jgi:hypothetical protein